MIALVMPAPVMARRRRAMRAAWNQPFVLPSNRPAKSGDRGFSAAARRRRISAELTRPSFVSSRAAISQSRQSCGERAIAESMVVTAEQEVAGTFLDERELQVRRRCPGLNLACDHRFLLGA